MHTFERKRYETNKQTNKQTKAFALLHLTFGMPSQHTRNVDSFFYFKVVLKTHIYKDTWSLKNKRLSTVILL